MLSRGWMPARLGRAWIASALAMLAALLSAGSAHAALTFSNAVAAPANTQAGAHSNFTLSFDIAGDDIKNLTTELPPGLVGAPTSAPYCFLPQLMSNSCPASSIIGSASSNVTATPAPPLPATLPLTASGNVYNVFPQGNDPATLGIVLTAISASPLVVSDPVILIGHASARSSDFGLNTTINDIPTTASLTLLPGTLNEKQSSQVHIDSTSLTLNGSNPQFMTNPTSCGTKTTTITGTSYQNTSATITASFNSTGCQNEAYNPNLGVTIDMSGSPADVLNPALTTEVTQGTGEANSKRVEAILPSSVVANNDTLNHQCPTASFPLDPNVPQTCPASTQVGTAVARTPLLNAPLAGPVYLIQNVGLLPKVGLDLKGPLPARILGDATPTSDFRLDNVFGTEGPGLPDVPLTDFKLTFNGGKGGLIVATDQVCKGPNTFNAVFDSFGGQHVTQQSDAKVIGCGLAKGGKLAVRVRCPRRAAPDHCRITAAAITRRKRGKKMTATARTRLKAGKSRLLHLKVKKRYLNRLTEAHQVLVLESVNFKGKTRTLLRRVRSVHG